MGIHHALYSGVTGLSTNSDGMSVVANNIANANTRGFKSDRAEFEDLLSVSLNESSQLGRGARLRNITKSFSQGALTPTGNLTDMGIQGDGFFILKNRKSTVQESGGQFYSRLGSFRFDAEGNLSDINGSRVQGYMSDDQGKVSSKLTDIQVTTDNIPPVSTSVVTLAVNLDTRASPPKEDFDVMNPSLTSNHSSTVTVFDNMGTAHTMTIYFSRTADTDQNEWKWHATVNGDETVDGPGRNSDGKAIPQIVAEGTMLFDDRGKPMLNHNTREGVPTYIDTVEQSDAFEMQFNEGAIPQKLQFNFGPNIDEDGNVGENSSTSMAANFSTLYHSQNGYEAGYMRSLKVTQQGDIKGMYTNGVERRLGVVALATFSNSHALQKVGQNLYVAPPLAGSPRTGTPQTGNRGSIFSASLEESNVDLAQQFVDMITTQRSFQANSKSITTTDSMLEEVVNLRR